MILMMFLGTMSGISGCVKRWPVLQLPPSPQLEVISQDDLDCLDGSVQSKLIMNDLRLKNFAVRLQATIEAYNKKAQEHNLFVE